VAEEEVLQEEVRVWELLWIVCVQSAVKKLHTKEVSPALILSVQSVIPQWLEFSAGHKFFYIK
jgi:hypothetical protein